MTIDLRNLLYLAIIMAIYWAGCYWPIVNCAWGGVLLALLIGAQHPPLRRKRMVR